MENYVDSVKYHVWYSNNTLNIINKRRVFDTRDEAMDFILDKHVYRVDEIVTKTILWGKVKHGDPE